MRDLDATILAVFGSALACDTVSGIDPAAALRVAEDEVAFFDLAHSVRDEIARRVVEEDADALVLDVSEGWTAVELDGPSSRDAFGRLSELRAPADGSVLGDVAHVAARVRVNGQRIRIYVPAMFEVHLRERIRESCASLLR